jgi:hypothetical protein
VLRSEFGVDRPKLGETVTFQGAVYRITAIGIPLDDDCPYLETRELVEGAERRLVTWTLKAKSICGQHDARKLIEAWHDPVWATQNNDHPFAYIITAFRNAGLLAAEVGRLAPVALIRKGQRFALIPFDATPERRQELLTALEK